MASVDWLEFLSTILATLAWPAFALLVLLAFHEPLRALIPRLQSVKGPNGWEAVFAALKSASPDAGDGGGPSPPPAPGSTRQTILALKEPKTVPTADLHLAALNPTLAIQSGWTQVSQGLAKRTPKARAKPKDMVEASHGAKAMPAELLVHLRLLEIIHEAVEKGELAPTPTQAAEYLEAAQRAQEALQRLGGD